jgi:hypothetical protein
MWRRGRGAERHDPSCGGEDMIRVCLQCCQQMKHWDPLMFSDLVKPALGRWDTWYSQLSSVCCCRHWLSTAPPIQAPTFSYSPRYRSFHHPRPTLPSSVAVSRQICFFPRRPLPLARHVPGRASSKKFVLSKI